MTDTPQSNPKPIAAKAERIAKVMARAGVASRRDAERMILEGRVSVNGTKIDSPALDVLTTDKIRVDGKPLDEPQETRLWLYYKPIGLVTSASDEKGRQTVFDALPRDLPRVMTVGRLDLNSEGLLLLTNDGELKRRLELPTTGWLRRYRVRVNGQPNDLTFASLRRGVTIDGEEFAPMEINLDSQQGANAWLTVGIREGRNREIRRAMSHVGLIVNRLIRIGYGPFKLTGLEANEVREVKRKMLRDQLGGLLTGEVEEKPRSFRERGSARPAEDDTRPPRAPRAEGDRKPYARREDGERKPFGKRPEGDRKPFAKREDGDRKPYARREDGERKPFGKRPEGDHKPFAKRDDGDRKPYARREDGERKPFGKRPDGDRKPFAKREDDDRKPYARREDGERKPFGKRPDGDRKPFAKREDGDRKPYARREDGNGKPAAHDGARKPFNKGPRDETRRDGDRPERAGKPAFKSRATEGERGFKPRGAGKPARDFKPGKASGKPADKPGSKPGFGKTSRAPGKGARPEGKG
ncbi:pseudouridine synthase, partial [Paracoccus sp. (in: a-proteobacteria)]|uniref:pseudouridine synthase n=1 Tax=Paracoccus sp. TaxID=267 RepID=UPI0028B1FCE7